MLNAAVVHRSAGARGAGRRAKYGAADHRHLIGPVTRTAIISAAASADRCRRRILRYNVERSISDFEQLTSR
jgi:hypothetical protein